jgi:hypothetical protein
LTVLTGAVYTAAKGSSSENPTRSFEMPYRGEKDNENFLVVYVTLTSAVAPGGTFTVNYPAGYAQEDFVANPTPVTVYGRPFECAVSLGADKVTVTWPAGAPYDLPFGKEFTVRLDMQGQYDADDGMSHGEFEQRIAESLSLAAAGLAIGTTTTYVATNNAVPYVLNGVFHNLSATDDAVQIPATTDLGNDEKALFLVGVDDQGNVGAWGTEPVASGADAFWPTLPEGYAPLGGVKVVTDGSTNFDPGTDALNKTGVTATYYDFMRVPVTAY